MKRPSCGLLYGSDIHHIDHIAPLCAILNIPLIVTSEEVHRLATEFYPNLTCQMISIDLLPESIVPNFDVIFSCLPTQLLDPIFSLEEHKQRKKLLFAWLPHGNSDKDHLAALQTEKYLLIYGDQMHNTLKKRNVLKKVSHITRLGNFRYLFYLKHKVFFDRLANAYTYFTHDAEKTLLYAPTWGGENLSTNTLTLLQTLPQHYNLLVKFHPNTLYTGFAIALKEAFADQNNIHFVDALPLIYPLMAKSDIYIGDHSSIAYDFLSLGAPLYFLTEKKTPIHHTGILAKPEEIYPLIDEGHDPHPEARQTLYRYAFEPTPPLELIEQIISQDIETYFASEPHVL